MFLNLSVTSMVFCDWFIFNSDLNDLNVLLICNNCFLILPSLLFVGFRFSKQYFGLVLYCFVCNCRGAGGGGGSNCRFWVKKPSNSFNYYKRMTYPPILKILIISPVLTIWHIRVVYFVILVKLVNSH